MIITSMGYGYNDLCIVPATISKINSRKEVNPFIDNMLPIFAAPMSAVVNVNNYEIWLNNKITPILPRNINFEIRLNFLQQGKWVAVSLTEFRDIFISKKIIDIHKEKQYRVCVDLANGHMQSLLSDCYKVKQLFPNVIIMTGNIANPETYLEYCNAGIDYVRCSIGSGSCCTTASNTAIHYPIASLIDKINTIKYNRNLHNEFCTKVIADGGIRNYNDVIKALALGADYAMIGGLFATFIESAGEVVGGDNFVNLNNIEDHDIEIINRQFDADYLLNKIIIKGPLSTSDKFDIYNNCEGVDTLKVLCGNDLIQYFYIFDIYNNDLNEEIKRSIIDLYKFKKRMYGMSTKTAQRLIKSDNELKTAEGIEKTIDVKYTIKQWIENMEAYLRSAMSYCNAKTLEDFIGKQTLKVQSPGEIYSVNK